MKDCTSCLLPRETGMATNNWLKKRYELYINSIKVCLDLSGVHYEPESWNSYNRRCSYAIDTLELSREEFDQIIFNEVKDLYCLALGKIRDDVKKLHKPSQEKFVHTKQIGEFVGEKIEINNFYSALDLAIGNMYELKLQDCRGDFLEIWRHLVSTATHSLTFAFKALKQFQSELEKLEQREQIKDAHKLQKWAIGAAIVSAIGAMLSAGLPHIFKDDPSNIAITDSFNKQVKSHDHSAIQQEIDALKTSHGDLDDKIINFEKSIGTNGKAIQEQKRQINDAVSELTSGLANTRTEVIGIIDNKFSKLTTQQVEIVVVRENAKGIAVFDGEISLSMGHVSRDEVHFHKISPIFNGAVTLERHRKRIKQHAGSEYRINLIETKRPWLSPDSALIRIEKSTPIYRLKRPINK